MSKTKKDRPYHVKAAEANKGLVRHDKRCNNLNHEKRSEEFTKVEKHIFYAHEVAGMEDFENTVLEKDGTFTVVEKAGYAILREESDPYLLGSDNEGQKLVIREDVVSSQNSGLGPYSNRSYSTYNIFYVYEATYITPNRYKDADCCGEYLPKSMTSKNGGCSCCSNHKTPERKTKVRDELKNAVKEANS